MVNSEVITAGLYAIQQANKSLQNHTRDMLFLFQFMAKEDHDHRAKATHPLYRHCLEKYIENDLHLKKI